MPNTAQLMQALYGTWRFAFLDRGAMRFFDISHHGVWRSFWAAPICYPGFVILLLLRLDADTIARAGFIDILTIETIGYVIAWTAFPLLVLGFCRWLGREEQGFEFIVAYNWSQVLQTVLLLIVAFAVDNMLPDSLGPDLNLLAYFAVLAYEWFIALVAIGAGGWVAAAVVLIDVVLGSTVVLTAGSLY
jgi:hypothetical protein